MSFNFAFYKIKSYDYSLLFDIFRSCSLKIKLKYLVYFFLIVLIYIVCICVHDTMLKIYFILKSRTFVTVIALRTNFELFYHKNSTFSKFLSQKPLPFCALVHFSHILLVTTFLSLKNVITHDFQFEGLTCTSS